MREQVEAMKEIWTKDVAEYHGQIVDFPAMNSWPKPVQKPHPPVIVGGAFRLAARRALRYGDGILPAAPSAGSAAPRSSCRVGVKWPKRPAGMRIVVGDPGWRARGLDLLKRNRDLGVTRMTCACPRPKKTRSCHCSTAGRS